MDVVGTDSVPFTSGDDNIGVPGTDSVPFATGVDNIGVVGTGSVPFATGDDNIGVVATGSVLFATCFSSFIGDGVNMGVIDDCSIVFPGVVTAFVFNSILV